MPWSSPSSKPSTTLSCTCCPEQSWGVSHQSLTWCNCAYKCLDGPLHRWDNQTALHSCGTPSCRRPPLIHFNLSFGSALGGGATAGLIKMWLDPFLRHTLTSLLVWPNRIVFPILPESPANNLEDLSVRHAPLCLSLIR